MAHRLAQLVGPAGADVVDAYRGARLARGEPVTGRDLWTAVTTDYVFRLPLLALAAAHAKYQPLTFSYLFTWESPFLNGMFGSCHGLEIPFVFGTVGDAAVQPFTGGGPAGDRTLRADARRLDRLRPRRGPVLRCGGTVAGL